MFFLKPKEVLLLAIVLPCMLPLLAESHEFAFLYWLSSNNIKNTLRNKQQSKALVRRKAKTLSKLRKKKVKF